MYMYIYIYIFLLDEIFHKQDSNSFKWQPLKAHYWRSWPLTKRVLQQCTWCQGCDPVHQRDHPPCDVCFPSPSNWPNVGGRILNARSPFVATPNDPPTHENVTWYKLIGPVSTSVFAAYRDREHHAARMVVLAVAEQQRSGRARCVGSEENTNAKKTRIYLMTSSRPVLVMCRWPQGVALGATRKWTNAKLMCDQWCHDAEFRSQTNEKMPTIGRCTRSSRRHWIRHL